MMWRTVTIIIIVVECGRCGKKLPKWPLVTVQDEDLKKCIYIQECSKRCVEGRGDK